MKSNSNTTQRSFFDLLALADVERVHSSVIGWLLSDDCKALAIEERSQVLHKLFGVEETKVYEEIKMELEWENIDIFWKTKDEDDIEACWVLENKLKSSQHSNQLEKYRECVEEIYQNRAKYCFLTVIGEPAKSREYKNRTYADLVAILKPYFEDTKAEPHWIIAREYFETIRRMTEVTKAFLKTPANFPHVFTDGNKGMQVKLDGYKGKNLTEDEMYIAQRGMETLMQKYYLLDVVKEIIDSLNEPQINWHVGETRGNADMGFHFENYIDRRDGKDYHFDISFQAGTFKFAVSYKYREAVSRDPKVRQEFTQRWESIFRSLKQEYRCKEINRGKSRSRISVCYPISSKEWYKLPKEEFVLQIKQEVQKAIQMKAKAIKEYEQQQQPNP